MPHNPNPTHSVKINAVINNPHITDWHFTKRLSDLNEHWLYGQMDAEWHWYRLEYQSRGSTHAHSCAKLTSDSSLKNSWAAYGPGNSNHLEIILTELKDP